MPRQPDDILDELLVVRAQGGDPQALAQLVSRWQARLRRHAEQMTGRHDVADDVAQDAWLAIIRGLRRLNDPSTFRSWAYRIVHNKSVDWVRRQMQRRELTATVKDQSHSAVHRSAADDDRADDLSKLKAAIERLNAEQQVLLRMYYIDQMSLKEISFTTGTPAGTLKYRLFKLRNQLKTILERNVS